MFNGFVHSLTMVNLLACFFGALIGTIVGVLPGLGPTATMALMLPFTMQYGPTVGLIMLTGVWYGAMYGGSTTSILVNIPGEAASVITCLDGYQMAKKGKGRCRFDPGGRRLIHCGNGGYSGTPALCPSPGAGGALFRSAGIPRLHDPGFSAPVQSLRGPPDPLAADDGVGAFRQHDRHRFDDQRHPLYLRLSTTSRRGSIFCPSPWDFSV